MAEVQELQVRISAKDELTEKMVKAQKELDKFAKTAKETNNKLEDMGNGGGFASEIFKGFLEGIGVGNIKMMAFAVAAEKATKAIIEFGKQCLEAQKQARQLDNLMDFTFGAQAKDLTDFSEALGNVYGTTNQFSKGNLTQFTQLGESIGFTKQDATDLAKSLTKLASEYENAFGQGSEAASAFEQAIKGNYRGLTNLGIVLNDTKMEAIAMSMGISGTADSWNEITKAAIAYEAILRETAGVTELAQQSAYSWATVTAQLEYAWTDFMVQIGELTELVLAPIVKGLTYVVKAVTAVTKVVVASVKVLMQLINFLTFGIAGKVLGWFMGGGTQSVAVDTGRISTNLTNSAKAMGANNSGADKLNKNLGNANKSAQALKKTLLGFDEMNVLNEENGSIGSLGSLGLGDLSFNPPDFSDLISDLDSVGISAEGAVGHVSNLEQALKRIEDAKVEKAIEDVVKSVEGLDVIPSAAEIAAQELWEIETIIKGIFDDLPTEVKGAFDEAGVVTSEGFLSLLQQMEARGFSIEQMFGDQADAVIEILKQAGVEIEENEGQHYTNLYDGQEAYYKKFFNIFDKTKQHFLDVLGKGQVSAEELTAKFHEDQEKANKLFWDSLKLAQGSDLGNMIFSWMQYWDDLTDVTKTQSGTTAEVFQQVASALVGGVTSVANQGANKIIDWYNNLVDIASGVGVTGLSKRSHINLGSITSTFTNIWTGIQNSTGINLFNGLNVNASISNNSLNSAVNSNSRNSSYTVGWANR